jgi:hypothetical protein
LIRRETVEVGMLLKISRSQIRSHPYLEDADESLPISSSASRISETRSLPCDGIEKRMGTVCPGFYDLVHGEPQGFP